MLVVAEPAVAVVVEQLVEIVVVVGFVVAGDDLQATVEHDVSVVAAVVVAAAAVLKCGASVEYAVSSAGSVEEC